MATFKKFEEIECWKKPRELTRRIYEITNQPAFARDFGLKDQIRRASVSVMSNIAEGYLEVAPQNLFIFWQPQRVLLQRFAVSSTWLPIRVTFNSNILMN